MPPRRSTRLAFSQKLNQSQQLAQSFLIDFAELRILSTDKIHIEVGHIGPIGSCPSGLKNEGYLEWYLNLCKKNMRELYEAVWGWDDQECKYQFEKEGSHFFIGFLDGDPSTPVGLCQVTVEWYYNRAVIYIYEIQIEAQYQGVGLGHHFMTMVETMGQCLKLDAVVLTCMKANTRAMHFYKKHELDIDDSSPEEKDNAKYVILSKKLISQA